MASHYSHRNAIAAIGIGIVVTFIVSVMSQQKMECPDDGCHFSALTRPNTIVFANNFSKVPNSSNCFPINTLLLYACLRTDRQFKPPATLNTISRKCTGSGWLNGDNEKREPPKCENRLAHCHFPPARSDPNTIIQIDGRNITDISSALDYYYSENTAAIYMCKNSKPNANDSSQEWRCRKNNNNTYSWQKLNSTVKDLFCDDGNGKGSTGTVSPTTVIPTNLNTFASEPTHESRLNDNRQTPDDPGSSSLLRDLLIGICSFLGFVMIVVLFGLLYRNRARHGKRYNNTANQHARQSPFASMSEEKNKSKEKFADGEENLVYANIIPIKVNQETIYAEVETGKIGKSRPTNIKLTIDDEQSHTTYAEIRHSVIPEDQRR